MTYAIKKSLMIMVFVVVLALVSVVLIKTKANAQSMTIAPTSGNITVDGTQNINITVSGITAGINAATLRISVPSSTLQVTAFTKGTGLLEIGCATGSTTFDADEICVDLASGSDFTNGQVIGTFTVKGLAAGSAPVTFETGNKLSDGSNDFAVTGTAGTFTVATTTQTSGTTTLPNTSLEVDEVTSYRNIIIALSLFSLAALSYVVVGSYLNRK